MDLLEGLFYIKNEIFIVASQFLYIVLQQEQKC